MRASDMVNHLSKEDLAEQIGRFVEDIGRLVTEDNARGSGGMQIIRVLGRAGDRLAEEKCHWQDCQCSAWRGNALMRSQRLW